jgi:hypothetical protein
VSLDIAGIDWVELDEMVREAFRTVAPPKLAALLDSP